MKLHLAPLGAFTAACLLLPPAATAQQPDPLQQGLTLFRQQNYEDALSAFQAAKQTRAPNAQLDNIIGITETRLGQLDAANSSYEESIRLDPKLADAHKNLGYNFIGQKKYDQAEKQLDAALAIDGAEPFTHYYLVVLYVTTSRDKDAVPHIKAAESALVGDPNTAILAVKAALNAGERAAALHLIESLEAGSRLSPEQEYAVAHLLNDHQMYADAALRFQRVLDLQPASWQNKYNLALAWAKAGQPKQALPLLADLTQENDGNADILASVASAYEAAGASEQALNAYQKAIGADPANPDRYLDCSRLLIDLDRYPEATAVVEKGLPLVPDVYPLTIRLGAIAGMQGDRARARETYRKAIAEHPTLALAYVALAQTYMKEGNDQEALKIISDARTLVPVDFALEYVYGLISIQLGNEAQALEAWKTAEKMDASVAEPHYQLGLLYMKRQQWKEAQGEFERVLAIDPQNAPTYYQLSRTYQRLGETEKAQETSRQAGLLAKTQRDDAMKAQELRFGLPNKN
jgi:tetratricopeptide (TPR) repeat protein